jgi:tetratricopeptide (TPR) repeat protein
MSSLCTVMDFVCLHWLLSVRFRCFILRFDMASRIACLRVVSSLPLAMCCFGQIQFSDPCSNPKAFASMMADVPELRQSFGIDTQSRRCAGRGYITLGEEAFNAGRLADATRHATAANHLLDREPWDLDVKLSALRLQTTLYIERGLLSEARKLLVPLRTMQITSPEYKATLLGLLGAYDQASGQTDSAEREYLDAIEIWDRIGRGDQSISERSNLGVLYIGEGRFEKAVAVLNRAYSLLRSSVGNEGYHRLVVTNNLAVAHRKLRNLPQAVAFARSAVQQANARHTARQELVANVYMNAALILRAAGRRSEAEDIEDKARHAAIAGNSTVDASELEGKRKRP